MFIRILNSTGSHGDIISIDGTGFDDSDPNNNEVIIGIMPCTVISADSTTINCAINNGPTGVADVKVYVDGKGLARTTVNFTYITGVDLYSSISGSVEGMNCFNQNVSFHLCVYYEVLIPFLFFFSIFFFF